MVDSNGTKLRIDLNALASRYKDLITATKDVATIIALIIAGLWTYALTKQFRDTVPKLAIKHDVSCWRMRDGSLLVRLDSTLTNTGKVLIRGLNGRLIVLRMLPETDEQAVAYAHGDIFYHCKDKNGNPIKNCIPEQGLNLPATSRKEFAIQDPGRSLEPGELKAYWRYFKLDDAARVVEVETFIYVPGSATQGWLAESVHELNPTAADSRNKIVAGDSTAPWSATQ